MNQQQAQLVIDQAKEIENSDFEAIIKKVYPDRTDLENILIGQLTLTEFLHLSKRISSQFISEFQDRSNYIILPYTFTNIQVGQANIDAVTQAYIANVSGGNFAAAEGALFWLISYQVENGFYYKPAKRQSEQISNSLSKLSEKLGLLETNIENKLKEVQSLYTELDTNKKEIQTLINQKRDELASITASLSTSITQSNQISELLNKGTEQSTRLNTIVEQQETTKTQTEKKLNELLALYDKTNADLNLNIKTVLTQIDEFKEQVNVNSRSLKSLVSHSVIVV